MQFFDLLFVASLHVRRKHLMYMSQRQDFQFCTFYLFQPFKVVDSCGDFCKVPL